MVLAEDYSFDTEAEACATPHDVRKDCSNRWLP
jgi:hypothetical protein